MHRCEFCPALFSPRPQVKRPRACPGCQQKRQRENEKSWHSRHKTGFDRRYHALQRELRRSRLRRWAVTLGEWLKVGTTFAGAKIDVAAWTGVLFDFLSALGVRRANKLWPAELP